MIHPLMIQDRMMMVKLLTSLFFFLNRIKFILDDSDPNPKRKKTDEVNETLVRIPLNRG
jgi:hypothetical protein